MSTLRALHPAPAVQRGAITLCATAAARTESGLYATVEAFGDGLLVVEPLALNVAAARREWAMQAEAAINVPAATLEAALLELVPLVEAALHGGAEHTAWPDPVPFLSPSLPRFPAEIFPAWLGDQVGAVAQAMQVPVDLPAMLALAVLSTACARRCVVQVRDGWLEPVNVYTIAVLPSGERKTPTFNAMAAPLAEWEHVQAVGLQDQLAETRAHCEVLEKTLLRAKEAAARGTGSERQIALDEALRLARELAASRPPELPRLLVSNVTSEKLAQLLSAHGGRMALLSDEAEALDIMAGRYTNGAPNIEVYLKGHSGSNLIVDRIGRPPDRVTRPALTLGLVVQPVVLTSLKAQPGFLGRGLLARFFYSLPPSLLGRRETAPPHVPMAVTHGYRAHVQALLDLPLPVGDANSPAECILRLAPEAHACFAAFERWLEPRLAPDGELGHMTDWAGKLAGGVARLSGLLHMAEHAGKPAPWSGSIGKATVEAAITLAHYLIAHAQAAYTSMGGDPATDAARYLLRRIRERGWVTFTKQELWQATKGKFDSPAPLAAALSLLVERGYLRAQASAPSQVRRPGPPGSTYLVHPGILKSLQSLECSDPCEFRDLRDRRTGSRA